MKRDWAVVRSILENVESDTLQDFADSEKYVTNLNVSDEEFFGHVELLIDAEIIKRCSVQRSVTGKIISYNFNHAFITMYGHDFLDAMRDKTIWNQIKTKAINSGVSLSWEFIKAALPLVIKDVLKQ